MVIFEFRSSRGQTRSLSGKLRFARLLPDRRQRTQNPKNSAIPCRQKIWATRDTGNAHDFLTILLRKRRWLIASVAFVRDNLLRRLVMLPQDFIHHKKVGEQCAEMNGSVQIINQLGTDDLLAQNQLNGGKRVARVAIEH